MQVKVQVYYKAPDGNSYKKVLRYVNPNATDEVVGEFIQKLNSLTKNEVKGVFKLVNEYLSASPEPDGEDDILVSEAEINAILDENYNLVYDSDGISELEISTILNETYQTVDDPDPVNFEDFVF